MKIWTKSGGEWESSPEGDSEENGNKSWTTLHVLYMKFCVFPLSLSALSHEYNFEFMNGMG